MLLSGCLADEQPIQKQAFCPKPINSKDSHPYSPCEEGQEAEVVIHAPLSMMFQVEINPLGIIYMGMRQTVDARH